MAASELGIGRQGRIQERIRKEKAYIWVMPEMSKREELGIRLWFQFGQLRKLVYLFNYTSSALYVLGTWET